MSSRRGRSRGRPRKAYSPEVSTAVTPKSSNRAKKVKEPTPIPLPTPRIASSVTKARPKSRKVRSQKVKLDFPDEYSDSDHSDNSENEEDWHLPSPSAEDLLDDERDDLVLDVAGSFDATDADSSLAPWAEMCPEDMGCLELPLSSFDLRIPEDCLLSVVELYEFMRTYANALQVSPCLFEDFAAALSSSENSILLAELHIAFIRICWREDEDAQIAYTDKDTNNAWNILTQLLDHMTYAEILRLYVDSERNVCPDEVFEIISMIEYPFVDPAKRLTVLFWLRDRFLRSQDFKNIIKNEGKIMWESTCRFCGKLGNVVLCEGCEACYHQQCLNIDELPEGKWFCPVCEKHQIKGVSDSLPYGHDGEKTPLRMELIGRDRHARTYWFCCRRIFVHDTGDGSVHYYSTLPQLYELVAVLDGTFLEKGLYTKIQELLNDIVEQMAITAELTTTRRYEKEQLHYNRGLSPPPEAVLQMDNLNRISDILADCWNRAIEKQKNEEGVVEDPLLLLIEQMMGIVNGRLTNSFWSMNVDEAEVLEHRNKKFELELINTGFRIGFDEGVFRQYVNEFSVNDLSKTIATRKKESDRRKYLSGRFSLDDEVKFDWVVNSKQKTCFALTPARTCSFLEDTIIFMTKQLPCELMHRNWPKVAERWRKLLHSRSTAGLRECLLLLECGMRKPVFLPQWWNSLGCIRFARSTIQEREERSKVELKKKKVEREMLAADPDDEEIIWVKFTKLGAPPKHALWRLRDEQYRINGKGALGGWIWVSRTYTPKYGRNAMILNDGSVILDNDQTKKDMEFSSKSERLKGILQKVVKWRTMEEAGRNECENKSTFEMNHVKVKEECENDLQNLEGSEAPIKVEEDEIFDEKKSLPFMMPSLGVLEASGIVKAKNPEVVKRMESVNKMLETNPSNIAGEDLAFAMQGPNRFRSKKSGKHSLMILPKPYLRRLSRQGGLNPGLFIPGFSRTAKACYYFWNYPSARPQIDVCWRWNTMFARSLHAVALQLRLLFACIRWGDLLTETVEEEKTKRVTTHLADRDEIRRVVGHKEMPPDGFYERYRIEVEVIMMDEDEFADNDTNFNARSGSRPSRKRKSVRTTKSDVRAKGPKKIVHRWIDGVDLKLWEIVLYWQRRQSHLQRGSVSSTPTPRMTTQERPIITTDTPTREAIRTQLGYGTPSQSNTIKQRREMPQLQFSRSTGKKAHQIPRLSAGGATTTLQKICAATPVAPSLYSKRAPSASYSSHRSQSPASSQASSTESPHCSGSNFTKRIVRYTIQRDGTRRLISETHVPATSQRVPMINRDMYATGPVTSAESRRNPNQQQQPRYVVGTRPEPAPQQYYDQREPTPKRYRAEDHSGQNMTGSGMMFPGGTIRGGGPRRPSVNRPGTNTDVRSEQLTSTQPSQNEACEEPYEQERQQFTEEEELRAEEKMSDEAPPVIPRYDSPVQPPPPTSTAGISGQRTVPLRSQTGQVIIQSNGLSGRKVLMIRRSDGTTQMFRPVAKEGGDGQGHVLGRITNQRILSQPMGASNPSTSALGDHADMVQMPARRVAAGQIVGSVRGGGGRPMMRGGTAVGRTFTMATTNGARRPLMSEDADPFMKRMAAEKANSGAPTLQQSYGQTVAAPSVAAGNRAYAAAFYGKEQLEAEEYQGRASVRPAVRITNAYGGMGVKQPIISTGNRLIGPGGGSIRMDALRRHTFQQPLRNVTSYKEFMQRRGLYEGFQSRRSTQRPVRFEFESNEEEDRAIHEAIAREEELMRLEEEAKNGDAGRPASEFMRRYEEEYGRDRPLLSGGITYPVHGGVPLSRREPSPVFCKSLLPHNEDDPDTKVIKQMLESMVTQVCKWDKKFGWYKLHLRKPKYKMARKVYLRQNEMMLSDHIDRLRKEINKRRCQIENQAEDELGLLTPWRKARGRPGKRNVKREDSVKPDGANANKDQPQLKKKHSNGVQHVKTEPIEVVNPAEISLGIDALDWGRKYIKEESDRMSQRSGRSSNSRRSIMMVRRLRESSADESAGGHRSRSPRKMHHSRHERDKDSSAEEGGVLMLCPSGTPNRGRGRPRKSESEKRRREAEERLRQLRATLNNPQRVIDTSQLHCICQTPYDDRKFYVACNTCGRWYHGKCVGISEKKAKRLSSFACGMCQDGVDKIDSDDSDDSEDEEETLTVVDRHCPRKYSQQHHPISVRELEPEKKVHLTTPIHEEEEEEEEEDDEDQVLDVDDMKVELYCVCQTPYDDSQFYVGCDGCEGWFHPRCVNITQEEAEMAAEYLCPSCRPRSSQEHGNTECMMEQVLNRADYPLVWRLYESVAEHRQAWPFKEPVDTQQFPTYLDVVKQPMDLSTIHNKLSSLEYRRLKEFSYDVLLMFENAKAFNIKDSAIWQCANTLEHVYRQSLTEIKAEMMTRHNNDGGDLRRVSECPSTMMDIDADQLIDVEMEMDPQFIEQLMGTPL